MVTVQLWIPNRQQQPELFPRGYTHVADVRVERETRLEWMCEAAIMETGSYAGNCTRIRPDLMTGPAREGDVVVVDDRAYLVLFVGVRFIKTVKSETYLEHV